MVYERAVGLALVLAGALASAPVAGEGWERHDNLPTVVGADGKSHTAACSGYPGTDPRFSFWSRKGTSKNLVVYFEGGGACWDSLTCTFPALPGLPSQVPQFYFPAVVPGTDPTTFDGIFKLDDPANPVRDWSFVYIPYCTGDLHLGSATKTYPTLPHPAFPLPPAIAIEHRGFDNFMVVLDWVKRNVDAPKSVLVAGPSAGGYGASANFPWVAQSYPNAHVYVIADSSQGVTTDAWDVGNPGRNSWNPQLAPWVYGTDLSTLLSQDLLAISARAYPHAKVAQYTSAFDASQTGFYGVMKQFYGPAGSCANVAVDWHDQMLEGLADHASSVPNERWYVAQGSQHTILGTARFYSESSAGIPFSRWVGTMLQNRGGTNGNGGGDWKDVACPTCLVALPCP